MSNVTIDLLHEKTIGKNYQLAALGTILDDVPNELREKIIEGIMKNSIELKPEEYNLVKNYLSKQLGIVCNFKKNYSCNKMKLELDESSTQDLLHQVKIPRYLRLYAFSSYKNTIADEQITRSSLLIAKIGRLISHIGTISIASKKNISNKKIEIYVIPDGSISSLNVSRTFYNLLYLNKDNNPNDNLLVNLIKKITNELKGVSIDQAIFLSFMIYLANINNISESLSSEIESLTNSSSFESFIVSIIEPGKRYQLRFATPLSISSSLKRLIGASWMLKKTGERRSLLEDLDWLISSNKKLKDSNFRALVEAASSRCLESIFRYMETGYYDALLECSRNLVSVCDKARNLLKEGNEKGTDDIRKVKQAAEKMLFQISRIR